MKRIFFMNMVLLSSICLNAQSVKVENSRADAMYKCGELAEFSATVQDAEKCTVVISNDGGKEIKRYEHDLSKDKQFKINAGTMDTPGFLRVTVISGKVNDLSSAAFEPEKIKAGLPEPSDFDEFWSGCIKRQKEIKNSVQLIPTPRFDDETCSTFRVDVATLDNEKLYGYMTVPKKKGKFPVMIHVPGASKLANEPNKSWASKSIIFIVMNVHRFEPSNDAKTYEEQKKSIIPLRYSGLPDREKYYYRNAILGISDVIDYMSGYPQWDGRNMIFNGASQGGAFALFMGGLNKNLTAVVSEIAAMCDHGGYLTGRESGWPWLYQQPQKNKELNLDDVMKMSGYFDGVNFAKRIKVPLLMTVGFKDNTCCPSSVYAAYNSANTEKKIANIVGMGHGTSSKVVWDWLKPQIK